MEDLFSNVFLEADDGPPDIGMAPGGGAPPPASGDGGAGGGGGGGEPPPPPDMMDNPPMTGGAEPPDIGGPDVFDDPGPDGSGGEALATGDEVKNMHFDEKISNIMNQRLYQRFLSLLNNLNGQLGTLKGNAELISTISANAPQLTISLEKLDENIRTYLSTFFVNKNYSHNLFFFNKCLNLYKMYAELFDREVKRFKKGES